MPLCNRIPAALLLVVAWTAPAGAQAQTVLPEVLLSLSDQELESGQVKFAYLGPSDKLIMALIMTVQDHAVNGDASSLIVSLAELRGVIRSIQMALGKPPKRPDMPWLSAIAAAGPAGHIKGFEAQLDQSQAAECFVLMRGVLRADPKDVTLMEGKSNVNAMRTLQGWGCALGLLPQSIPAKDVSSFVRVETDGLQYNPFTKRFGTTAKLTNISNAAIQGPISLVIYPGVNVSLANAMGNTCITTPSGREFVNVPMPGQNLEPKQTLKTVLEFEHEEGAGLLFNTRVLAGVGER